MSVLSFALHLWSSTSYCTCSPSKEEFEFCKGVGGVILLLDNGGAFTCQLSYLNSSCVLVQQCARFFWRKKRTAVPHLPNQSNTKKPHKTQGPQKKRKHAHQSKQAPHAQAHKHTRIRLTIRQVLMLLQEVPQDRPPHQLSKSLP